MGDAQVETNTFKVGDEVIWQGDCYRIVRVTGHECHISNASYRAGKNEPADRRVIWYTYLTPTTPQLTIDAATLALMESKLAAAEKRVAELEAALTPFALAAEDASVTQAGGDFVLHIRHKYAPRFIPIYVNGNTREWTFLDATHLQAAATALKAGKS